MIIYTRGNIFESHSDVLVNPVNCVGVMGAGLAKQFALRYPPMLIEYMNLCRRNELNSGKLHVWYGQTVTVVNLPTKFHWSQKSTLEIVGAGLSALAVWMKQHPGVSVALPPLGCGLGGLKWSDVKPLIELRLGSLTNEVYVYGEG